MTDSSGRTMSEVLEIIRRELASPRTSLKPAEVVNFCEYQLKRLGQEEFDRRTHAILDNCSRILSETIKALESEAEPARAAQASGLNSPVPSTQKEHDDVLEH